MGIWEAMEKLSELVDDSDPDVSVLRFLLPVLPLLCLHRLYAVIALVRVASFFSRNTTVASATSIFDDVTGCFQRHLTRVGILISCTFP